MSGIVFDIKEFAVFDGPGIRTTVFMKGCPLRCQWCHNPEGLSPVPQAQFFREECIGCGRCGGEHSLENASVCPSGALKAVGKAYTPGQLLEAVLADRAYYGQTGGVTFSGGEAMVQANFVCRMLSLLRAEGITTAIETCGAVPWASFEKTLGLCDTYLYDVKTADDALHREYTGRSNGLILKNLRKLSENGAGLWIRVPVIPGFNDTPQAQEAIAGILAPLDGIHRVTLIPYHTLGKSKYQTLGMTPQYHTQKYIDAELLQKLRQPYRLRALPVEER